MVDLILWLVAIGEIVRPAFDRRRYHAGCIGNWEPRQSCGWRGFALRSCRLARLLRLLRLALFAHKRPLDDLSQEG